MSKRTVFTTLTPLPAGITRATVLDTLHSHTEMIDLNPLVEERHPIKPPPEATAEEYHCVWYQLTDRVSYLPGGLMSGKVSYNACFHDLPQGLQTHVYAPTGLNIKGKWTLGGSLPGEPVAPMELGLGAPLSGLYLREDVDMKCNILMTSFVKKTLKKAHAHLVDRLLVKAQIEDAAQKNEAILQSQFNASQTSTQFSGDGQSTVDGGRDQRYSIAGAPQIPPMQHTHSISLRDPEHGDGPEDALYPRALSVRSSTASYHGSSSGSVRGSLYQDPPSQRVSWQNLSKGNAPAPVRSSPVPQHAELAEQPRQQPQPCAVSSPNSFHAELDSTPSQPQTTYHAELE